VSPRSIPRISQGGILQIAELCVVDFQQAFANKKVLITGGMGFIGSNLARRLVDLGARVGLVDSMIPQYGGNVYNIAGIEDKLTVDNSDVRDEQAMNRLVQGQDYLFNLAGQTSHMDSMENPHVDLDINCRSQLSILEACRRGNPQVKLVFASTRQIYGKPDYLPVDERHLVRPVDVNGINKTAGEFYHILYSNVYGIRACALRLTNTIGPRMRIKDARQTFVGIWVRLLLEGRPFDVWGGEQKRDYTDVDDAVDAFLLAAANEQSNGQVYNVGGLGVWTLKQTAEMLVSANGGGEFRIKEFPADRKRIDIGDYYADYFYIHQHLGWSPKTTLHDSLQKTVLYYKNALKHYI
jgi:UDP-glucose 4-epimerase